MWDRIFLTNSNFNTPQSRISAGEEGTYSGQKY